MAYEGEDAHDLCCIDVKQAERDGLYRVTDMIRATIEVRHPSQLISAYLKLATIPHLEVVGIQNNLKSGLRSVSVNFIYAHRVIGEIQMRAGKKPLSSSGTHLL